MPTSMSATRPSSQLPRQLETTPIRLPIMRPRHSNGYRIYMNTRSLPTTLTITAICISMSALSLVSMPSLAFAQVLPTPTPVTADVPSLTTTAIPPRLEILGKPGETIQKTIKIQNSATTTQYYSSSVED